MAGGEKPNLHETQVIINRLSKSLKEELLLNANGLTLKAIPLFSHNFSGESLRKTCLSDQSNQSNTGGLCLQREPN